MGRSAGNGICEMRLLAQRPNAAPARPPIDASTRLSVSSLPKQPAASRPERGTDRQLPLPRRRAHEQQVDDVYARRQQHEADQEQEHARDERASCRRCSARGAPAAPGSRACARSCSCPDTAARADARRPRVPPARDRDDRWRKPREHAQRVVVAPLDRVFVFRFRVDHRHRHVRVELDQRVGAEELLGDDRRRS